MRAHVAASELKVVSVEAREKRQNPAPPFTTPKLQQAAAPLAGLLGAQDDDASRSAYTRERAVGEHGHRRAHLLHAHRLGARGGRSARGGARAHPVDATAKHEPAGRGSGATSQQKDAQDAHEAIRPTTLELPPEAVAALPRARRAEALPADLEPLRRVGIEPGGVREHDSGHRSSARGLARPRAGARDRTYSRTRASGASTARFPRPRRRTRPRTRRKATTPRCACPRSPKATRSCSARRTSGTTRRSHPRASTRPRS